MTIKLTCDKLFQDLVAVRYEKNATIEKTEDGINITGSTTFAEALMIEKLKADPHVTIKVE